MKPVIGIMPLFDSKTNSIWMHQGYLKAIENTGGIPMIIPHTTDEELLKGTDQLIDAYLFTGGNDISNVTLDQNNIVLGNVNEIRDKMESFLYDLAKSQNKPLLGIGRGIEVINTLEGGASFDDFLLGHPSAEAHTQKNPLNNPSHEVILLYESPLHKLLGTERIEVNSYHDQAIKKMAPNLRIMAMALDDIVEGIYDKKRLFLWGIQWHPEYALEWKSSKKIFEKFLEMAEIWHNEYSSSK